MTLAYLDPASGSMIASVLVGGVAGVGVFAKQARAKFSRKKRTDDQSPAEAEAEATATTDAADTAAGAESVDATAEPADEPTTVSSDA